MANRAQLLAKLKNLQNKGQGQDIIWKPEEGETKIRIVPLATDPENPFIELFFHYGLGGKTYYSPLSYGERDPIAEFSDSLIGEGGLSKEEYKAAKQFYPALRTYLPIVVRGKEKEGVKYWAFGKQIFEQLLSIMTDEDYGDITDPNEGRDVKVTFTPKEKSDTNFAKTELKIVPATSALSKDKELLAKLLTEQPDLKASQKKHTYEELTAVLQRVLDPGTSPEEETPSPRALEDAPATVSKGALSEDVAEEFGKIFDN